MSEETQTEEQKPDPLQAWNDFLNHPVIQAFKSAQNAPEPHVHGPFVFLLNHNHNALRGCTTCGATWVGLMAGSEESLCWHPVREA